MAIRTDRAAQICEMVLQKEIGGWFPGALCRVDFLSIKGGTFRYSVVIFEKLYLVLTAEPVSLNASFSPNAEFRYHRKERVCVGFDDPLKGTTKEDQDSFEYIDKRITRYYNVYDREFIDLTLKEYFTKRANFVIEKMKPLLPEA